MTAGWDTNRRGNRDRPAEQLPQTNSLTVELHRCNTVRTAADLVLHRKATIMANAPVIHVGSDTRAKSQAEALRDANFAITETGLQVTFTSGPHIAGAGTLNGAGVAVIVTCLPVNGRTFIEVVGTSLDSGAAEQARNRVRTITMGPPS